MYARARKQLKRRADAAFATLVSALLHTHAPEESYQRVVQLLGTMFRERNLPRQALTLAWYTGDVAGQRALLEHVPLGDRGAHDRALGRSREGSWHAPDAPRSRRRRARAGRATRALGDSLRAQQQPRRGAGVVVAARGVARRTARRGLRGRSRSFQSRADEPSGGRRPRRTRRHRRRGSPARGSGRSLRSGRAARTRIRLLSRADRDRRADRHFRARARGIGQRDPHPQRRQPAPARAQHVRNRAGVRCRIQGARGGGHAGARNDRVRAQTGPRARGRPRDAATSRAVGTGGGKYPGPRRAGRARRKRADRQPARARRGRPIPAKWAGSTAGSPSSTSILRGASTTREPSCATKMSAIRRSRPPAADARPGEYVAPPDVWHVDLLEWEEQGSGAEVCADVVLDAEDNTDRITRRSALFARLVALSAEQEAGSAAAQAGVVLARHLAPIGLYSVLAALERLYRSPDSEVRHAAVGGAGPLLLQTHVRDARTRAPRPEPRRRRRSHDGARALALRARLRSARPHLPRHDHARDPPCRPAHDLQDRRRRSGGAAARSARSRRTAKSARSRSTSFAAGADCVSPKSRARPIRRRPSA